MTIENTVSSDFWSAFVDFQERFRLSPIQCETFLWTTTFFSQKCVIFFAKMCDFFFFSIRFNIYSWCSKEPSHCVHTIYVFVEKYKKDTFWLKYAIVSGLSGKAEYIFLNNDVQLYCAWGHAWLWSGVRGQLFGFNPFIQTSKKSLNQFSLR